MAKSINQLSSERTSLIDTILITLEKVIRNAQSRFFDRLIAEIFDKLDLDNKYNLKNTARNKLALNSIDKLFSEFVGKDAINVVKEVVNGVDKIIDFNVSYFSEIDESPLPEFNNKIRSQISEWLGIDKGKLKPNGYLDTLIKDANVKKQVKDLTLKNVVTKNGIAETKKNLEALIKGSGKDLGAFEKYLGGYVYDTISVTDRIIGLEYADSKGYNFAIYEGGLIGTSREFCIKRNGKVFHRTEIAKFNPITARPHNYNPFVDLGGYRCRHHLNWISDSLAIRLRPDANKFISDN